MSEAKCWSPRATLETYCTTVSYEGYCNTALQSPISVMKCVAADEVYCSLIPQLFSIRDRFLLQPNIPVILNGFPACFGVVFFLSLLPMMAFYAGMFRAVF